jgi:membrane glycosyltransferase
VRADARRAYGGTTRFVVSAILELLVSMLVSPIIAVAVTLFLLGLPFGLRVGWTAQQRDVERVTFMMAAQRLWPQTIVGVTFALALWQVWPGAIWYGLPILVGLIGSIPLAMFTAHPRVGRALCSAGLFRVPEESRLSTGSHRAGRFAPFALASAASTAAAE